MNIETIIIRSEGNIRNGNPGYFESFDLKGVSYQKILIADIVATYNPFTNRYNVYKNRYSGITGIFSMEKFKELCCNTIKNRGIWRVV